VKKVLLALGLIGVLVAAWFLLNRPVNREQKSTSPSRSSSTFLAGSNVGVAVSSTGGSTSPLGRDVLLGETLLRDYGNSSLPPENDLTLLSHLMDNFVLLMKTAAERPLSANEDWAAALRGHNTARERFLPDQHVALNAQGQLVDRWGTPLFFHALGGRRFELRSAGPDHQLWTADDLHRNSDGSFRRGSELNPSSLVDAATRR
jgi:hypothetical protein